MVFGVTIEEAWQVFLAQDKKCAISGVELKFAKNYMKDPTSQTASLDRKDSAKDYTPENVQWVQGCKQNEKQSPRCRLIGVV